MRSKTLAAENIIVGKIEGAEKKFIALQNVERSIGTGLIYSRKGKPIADKVSIFFLFTLSLKSLVLYHAHVGISEYLSHLVKLKTGCEGTLSPITSKV